jgi:hypothetical protein
LIYSIMHGNDTPSTNRRFKVAIVISSHVTIYSHVQCHMAIFPPCLVFADFQFAAFTVFSIGNPLYVIYSAAFHLIITCIVSRFPRYFGASLGASVPVFIVNNQPFSQHPAVFFPFYRFNSPNYFEVRHLYSL